MYLTTGGRSTVPVTRARASRRRKAVVLRRRRDGELLRLFILIATRTPPARRSRPRSSSTTGRCAARRREHLGGRPLVVAGAATTSGSMWRRLRAARRVWPMPRSPPRSPPTSRSSPSGRCGGPGRRRRAGPKRTTRPARPSPGRCGRSATGNRAARGRPRPYLLIANASAFDGTARVTLYFNSGAPVSRDIPLKANSRTNVPVGDIFGADVANKRFGAVVESLPVAGQAGAQIVVERAMYFERARRTVLGRRHRRARDPAPVVATEFTVELVMKRLAGLIALSVLLAYRHLRPTRTHGPGSVSYDETRNDIRVQFTAQAKFLEGGYTRFLLTAYVPLPMPPIVGEEPAPYTVDIEIRKDLASGYSTIALCSHESDPSEAGTTVAFTCDSFATVPYSQSEGSTVQVYPYVVRTSWTGQEKTHDGRTRRIAITVAGDDAFENNDDRATATPLGGPTTEAVHLDLVSIDQDYYAVSVPVGMGSLSAQIEFWDADGTVDLDLTVLRPDGTELAVGEAVTDGKKIKVSGHGRVHLLHPGRQPVQLAPVLRPAGARVRAGRDYRRAAGATGTPQPRRVGRPGQHERDRHRLGRPFALVRLAIELPGTGPAEPALQQPQHRQPDVDGARQQDRRAEGVHDHGDDRRRSGALVPGRHDRVRMRHGPVHAERRTAAPHDHGRASRHPAAGDVRWRRDLERTRPGLVRRTPADCTPGARRAQGCRTAAASRTGPRPPRPGRHRSMPPSRRRRARSR